MAAGNIPRGLLFCLAVYMPGFAHSADPTTATPATLQTTIAFGSCLRQWQPQPVWKRITALSPNAFIFLGDNMYSDTGDYRHQPEPQRIATAYADLASTEAFQAFLENAETHGTALFATWDDHDYGRNDGGGDYPHKLASKAYFLDFFHWQETATGGKNHPGIYQSHRLPLSGLDVQVILLDTRSFRSPLKKDPTTTQCPNIHNVPNSDPDATVLGAQQWQWLEQQLQQPADLRLIASSIQVIPEQHCYEKWSNFPRQRQQLFQLINLTKAEGVVFISGDRHLAEISKLPRQAVGYPLYEITASGLNSAMGRSASFSKEPNRYRLDDMVFDDNFGAIAIQRENGKYQLILQIYQADGELARHSRVPLEALAFRENAFQ